jgi:hypothetical protein
MQMETDENRLKLCIAGITFEITADYPLSSMRLNESYRDFACEESADIRLHASYEGLPDIPLNEEDLVFDSGAVWRLYQIGGEYIFSLSSPVVDHNPYRLAIFDQEFRQGQVFNPRQRPGEREDGLLSNPMEYPFSEVLMVCLLGRGAGLMVHACGLDHNGRGYLFAGNSTHGKSTMARLWEGQATILNDDRIVLRQREGRFWMYGTPWHGEYSALAPSGVPLEKVFFLGKGEENHAQRQLGAAASSRLLARAFPPLWDPAGMAFTLEFCAQIAEAVPCYDLKFAPDGGIIDFVRGMD